jgi:hypothetical protein
MERCPPEIISQILAPICTDGGQMGCVLSLVSKQIAALAKPYRFHSACISGLNNLEAFDRVLSQTDVFLRRARHLMISDDKGTVTRDGKTRTRTFDDSWQDYEMFSVILPPLGSIHPTYPTSVDSDPDNSATIMEESEKFARLCGRILRSLAPHLRSLSLLLFRIHQPDIADNIIPYEFPLLRHFALYYRFRDGARLDPPRIIRMPNLVQLGFGDFPFARAGSGWIQSFVESSPHLSLIEIRGISALLPAWSVVGPLLQDRLIRDPLAYEHYTRPVLTFNASQVRSINYFRLPADTSYKVKFYHRTYHENGREVAIGTLVATDIMPSYAQLKKEWMIMLEQQARISDVF